MAESDEDDDSFSIVFNSRIREWLISFIAFCALFSIAYILIERWKKRHSFETELKNRFTLLLCALGLSIALAPITLLPLTVVADNLLKQGASKTYYWQWLSPQLLYTLWNNVFISISVILFIVIPFAYFYQEAEGLGTHRTAWSRAREATIVWVLTSVLFAALLYFARMLMFFLSSNLPDYIPFTYSLITILGSVFVLAFSPQGFTNMTNYAVDMFHGLRTLDNAEHQTLLLEFRSLSMKLQALDAEEQDQKRKQQQRIDDEDELDASARRWKRAALREVLLSRLQHTEANLSSMPRYADEYNRVSVTALLRWFTHNVIAAAFCLVNMIVPGIVVLRVAVAQLLVYFGGEQMFYVNILAESTNDTPGFKPSSIGAIVATVEVILVLYVSVAAFVGLYGHRWFTWLRPRFGDTSVHKMIVGTFINVLISGSLPVVARVLGLIRVDILALYKDTGYLKNPYFVLIFKILFTTLLIRRYWKELQTLRPRIRVFLSGLTSILSGAALRVHSYKKQPLSSKAADLGMLASNGGN